MDLLFAKKEMLKGKVIRRQGWNGKGMFLFNFASSAIVVNGDENFETEIYDMNECFKHVRINTLANPGNKEEDYKLDDFVLLKTAGNTCIPWNASQADLLADDWEYYDEFTEKWIDNPNRLDI